MRRERQHDTTAALDLGSCFMISPSLHSTGRSSNHTNVSSATLLSFSCRTCRYN
jgi:hypothetical protein